MPTISIGLNHDRNAQTSREMYFKLHRINPKNFPLTTPKHTKTNGWIIITLIAIILLDYFIT